VKYNVDFAYDMVCAAQITIEADSPEEAESKAKAMLKQWDGTEVGQTSFEPLWDCVDNHRVTWIEDAEGNTVSEGFTLEELP
jgi:hypothetical protein